MKKENRKRPHHRSIMLTVSKREYDDIKAWKGTNCPVVIRVVNDIIRTSRCGSKPGHHWERRYETVTSAIRGGWQYMKVRHSGGCEPLRVKIVRTIACLKDSPYFSCSVEQMEV